MSYKALISAVLAMSLLIGEGTMAWADVSWTFVRIECDPRSDTFAVTQISSYNEEGDAQDAGKANVEDSFRTYGVYNLSDLVTYSNDDDPVISETRTLKKTCQLSAGLFNAEVSPWSYNARALGMCGAAPPSVMLSLKMARAVLIDNLVFVGGESCLSPSTAVIERVLIDGKSKTIHISGEYQVTKDAIPLNKVFRLKPGMAITTQTIIYALPQIHEVALALYKETTLSESAIELLERAGVQGVLQERPADLGPSAYINLLNDYGFFLSETVNREKDAISVLQRVIALAPKRKVAYLNLGDAYWEASRSPAETKREFQERARTSYREYVRLLKEKHPEAEVPERVRVRLE